MLRDILASSISDSVIETGLKSSFNILLPIVVLGLWSTVGEIKVQIWFKSGEPPWRILGGIGGGWLLCREGNLGFDDFDTLEVTCWISIRGCLLLSLNTIEDFLESIIGWISSLGGNGGCRTSGVSNGKTSVLLCLVNDNGFCEDNDDLDTVDSLELESCLCGLRLWGTIGGSSFSSLIITLSSLRFLLWTKAKLSVFNEFFGKYLSDTNLDCQNSWPSTAKDAIWLELDVIRTGHRPSWTGNSSQHWQ